MNMDDATAIREVIATYLAAYQRRDAAGCGAVYTNDAIALSPWGPPIFGSAAIAAAHIDWLEEGETNKVMTIVDLVVDGDTGICLLHYEADVPGDTGETDKAFGASLNTLQRQPDSLWKIRHTSLNEFTDRPTGFDQ
ncbi:MAG: hypothetical protein ACI8R4_001993 [Paracoccaceae bacterium]|jgi:uncharacterized protein (TIGR02246 family)